MGIAERKKAWHVVNEENKQRIQEHGVQGPSWIYKGVKFVKIS